MNQAAKFVGWVVFRSVAVIYSGFVIATMWKWFATSAFGLPLISIPEAIGIGLFIALFDTIPTQWDIDHSYTSGISFGIKIGVQTFIFGYGWLVHLFL